MHYGRIIHVLAIISELILSFSFPSALTQNFQEECQEEFLTFHNRQNATKNIAEGFIFS